MVRKKDRYVPVMFVFKEEIPFTRPYEIDFLTNKFHIYLCKIPFMAMAVFRGSDQVKALLAGIQELANNAYFSEDDHGR